MITLYGITQSRASRVLWMLHELGVPFERALTNPLDGSTRQADYLAVNPNGHVPALRDGDLLLCESLAINLYLADKYGKLWPAKAEDRGRCYQWSVWTMTELEPLLMTVLKHRRLLPEGERDEAQAAQAQEAMRKPLGVLNGALEGRAFLLGPEFTVVDLNVAAVTAWARLGKVSLDAFPHVKAWLARCLERPAQQKVIAEARAAS
jgi:glutathione S-transferase